jgi:predicted nucleic acid-binding protein
MNGESVFLDSNVLIYAYSKVDTAKQQTARLMLFNNDCVVSTQVLGEYCNVGIKKLHYPPLAILSDIEEILFNCGLFVLGEETIQHALAIQARYGFSYYDSQILAAAIECQCKYLFSEDLQDGQRVDGVTVCNIFR